MAAAGWQYDQADFPSLGRGHIAELTLPGPAPRPPPHVNNPQGNLLSLHSMQVTNVEGAETLGTGWSSLAQQVPQVPQQMPQQQLPQQQLPQQMPQLPQQQMPQQMPQQQQLPQHQMPQHQMPQHQMPQLQQLPQLPQLPQWYKDASGMVHFLLAGASMPEEVEKWGVVRGGMLVGFDSL